MTDEPSRGEIVPARWGGPLAARTVDEALRIAELLSKSSMIPEQYRNKPADVLVAIQFGYELGLHPLQAMQDIAVIGKRPAVYGDTALALCKRSGLFVEESFEEKVEGDGDARVGICRVQRRSGMVTERRFTVLQAKKAGLWGKAGPWTQYSDRMLVLRARSFALRDTFPDVLKGLAVAEDFIAMPVEAEVLPADDLMPKKLAPVEVPKLDEPKL